MSEVKQKDLYRESNEPYPEAFFRVPLRIKTRRPRFTFEETERILHLLKQVQAMGQESKSPLKAQV